MLVVVVVAQHCRRYVWCGSSGKVIGQAQSQGRSIAAPQTQPQPQPGRGQPPLSRSRAANHPRTMTMGPWERRKKGRKEKYIPDQKFAAPYYNRFSYIFINKYLSTIERSFLKKYTRMRIYIYIYVYIYIAPL